MTTQEKKALTITEEFDTWMLNRVKNIHYANNEKMSKAHEKVYNNNLEKVCISMVSL